MNTHIHGELITYNLLSVPHGSQKQAIKNTIYNYRWFSLIFELNRTIYNCLVVDLPLWKIWVRQLGWWHSQYMELHKIPWFQTTNQIFIAKYPIISIWNMFLIHNSQESKCSKPPTRQIVDVFNDPFLVDPSPWCPSKQAFPPRGEPWRARWTPGFNDLKNSWGSEPVPKIRISQVYTVWSTNMTIENHHFE